MVVLSGGVRVFEAYAEPYRRGDRPLVYSASKTFTATAVGLAIGEGRFGLDDRIVDLLEPAAPEEAATELASRSVPEGVGAELVSPTVPEGVGAELVSPAVPEEAGTELVSPTVPEEADAEPAKRQPSRRAVDDRVAEITVHHLLSMSTGHTGDTIEAMMERPPEQWVEAFLAILPQQPVGSCHVYNNGASFLLGELVRRHTGEDLLDYLRPRVFEPLGIDATWDTDAAGRCLGWSGLHVDARGLAAMGELLRCDGVWQGRRLLPEGWVARATSTQIPTAEPSPEWNLGYGYQVWMNREGYRLDGAYGQFAFVLPGRDLVVAVQSAQSCTQVLVDLLWEHLPAPAGPAAANGPPASRRAVPEGLARVPVPSDSGLGAAWTHTGPVPLDASMVGDGEEVGRPADLAEVRASRSGGELWLDLVVEGHWNQLGTAVGEWRRQSLHLGDAEVPVALAAGADDAGDLHVRMVFTDTPHTLRLRLGADGRAAQAWKVNPLQGPWLASMRAH